MDFFEAFPAPSPPRRPARPPVRPWTRPDTVVPGSVAAEAVVACTDAVAVAVGSLRAYANGFEFTVHVRQRATDDDGFREPLDPLGRHPRVRGAAEPGRVLRLGIAYADGRRAAAIGHWTPADPEGDSDLVLEQRGSSGSEYRWDGEFWVHPLPPEGPVTFVVSWLAQDVVEERAEVDGAAIRAAATRAVDLWPGGPAAVASAPLVPIKLPVPWPDLDGSPTLRTS